MSKQLIILVSNRMYSRKSMILLASYRIVGFMEQRSTEINNTCFNQISKEHSILCVVNQFCPLNRAFYTVVSQKQLFPSLNASSLVVLFAMSKRTYSLLNT